MDFGQLVENVLGFFERPVNIYEAHAGSWKRNPDGTPYSFAQLKEELIPYLVEMNYTHIEFMPLMAHPLGLSWGYQLMGYFWFRNILTEDQKSFKTLLKSVI